MSNNKNNDFERFKRGDKVLFKGEIFTLIEYSYAKVSKVHWWASVKTKSGKKIFLPAYELTKECNDKIIKKETPRTRWYKQGKLK